MQGRPESRRLLEAVIPDVLDSAMAVPLRPEPPVVEPDPTYEPASVTRATATLELPARSEQHQPVEITLLGPSHGNPFVDVELQAE
ncbi:MAG TPA: hypothetical protein VFR35_01090, partial [Actinoplanes sp.]|nr:hypothetical protein [Actinoplanes sp.]